MSRGVKQLARELGVPVVVLCQLNRGLESRSDGVPRMSDLRESGAIEQDADVVMLLHRPWYHLTEAERAQPERAGERDNAQLIVAKQRNGPTDTVQLRWNAALTRFTDRVGGWDRGGEDGAGDNPFR
jgi:replicative DNA helicase